MIKCKTCGEEKEETEFHVAGSYSVSNGGVKTRYRGNCKPCVNAKLKQRYYNYLDTVVDEWKCAKCGYDESKVPLEFHHLDPDQKDFNISHRWSASEQRLREEINKCVLLCCRCHREVHAGLWDIKDLGL